MNTKREHRAHAEGSPRGNPYDLSHSPSGRLIGKFRDNNSVTLSATVDMAYGYCDDYQPHAVKRMFDYKNGMLYDMRWDEAGNLGQVSMAKPGGMFQAGRFLYWTEDCCGPRPGGANRMHAAVDDRYTSYYAYDYSGERRLKLTGKNDLLDVNADIMATYTLMSEPTLYPSAYMVLTIKGYTNVAKAESRASLLALPRRSSVTGRKHYYAGADRVAARMGGGGLDALYHAIGNNNTIQTKANLLFDQSLEQVNNRILYENDLDCIMHNDFAKEEFGHWIDGIPYRMQTGVELNHDQFKDMVNSMLDDINHGQEKEVYFYHSDLYKSREQSQAGLSYAETQQSVRSKHLGSASWITDSRGVAVQHIQYLPYGEPYVNQHPFGYSERFTFTGKEKDEETGYGYFGARYMDHELMTMWLSVDPMADKYPSMSPYNYCAGNPVKLVDPDGREVLPTNEDAYQMILMTVPESARDYIRCNKEGYIDRGLINLYDCENSNFRDLKELVNNDCVIEVSVSSSYNWINSEGKITSTEMSYCNPMIEAELMKNFGISYVPSDFKGIYSISTGETGEMGVTCLPISSIVHQSTNENIQVTINSQLSPNGRAENFSHEFYGHAYLFATTIDANRAVHDYSQPGMDNNLELKNRIIRAQNETIGYSK